MQNPKREFEGADLESALLVASERLGIPETEIDYEILELGRRGLFGIGAKNVRIRVMPPLDDEIPDPNKPRRSGRPRRERSGRSREREAKAAAVATGGSGERVAASDKPGSDRAGSGEDGADSPAPSRRRRSRNRRRRSKRDRQAAAREGEAAPKESGDRAAPSEADSPAEGQVKKEGSRRRRSRRSRSRRGGATREDASPRSDKPLPPADPEQVASVQATLQQMTDHMGMDVQSAPDSEGGGVRLNLDGPDRKLLMENDGELLGALQFLLNRMARRAWPGAGRILLGCNGQRTRRDGELVAMVEGAIAELERTGQPQQLREMNGYERRLVHITVRKRKGVNSSSEGDGHLKCVNIFKTGGSGPSRPPVADTRPAEDAPPDEVVQPPTPEAETPQADASSNVEEPAGELREDDTPGDRQG